MQASRTKSSKKQKDTKNSGQPKISGFFSKPKLTSTKEDADDTTESAPDATTLNVLSTLNLTALPSRSLSPIVIPPKIPDEDIIVIEDSSPVRPLKTEAIPTPQSRNKSIIVLPSPSPSPVRVQKSVHPFFQPRRQAAPVAPRQTSIGTESPIGPRIAAQLPPWPNFDSQHPGASRIQLEPLIPVFLQKKYLSPRDPLSDLQDDGDLSLFIDLTTPATPTKPSSVISPANDASSIDMPEEHRTYLAISRLTSGEFNPILQKPWNDKYAPKRAEEMLHNKDAALYLQKWLRSLEVQSEKMEHGTESIGSRGMKRPRPTIQRDVGKGRARKRQKRSSDPFADFDDFIVDDEDFDDISETEGEYTAEEDLPRTSTVSSPPSTRESSPVMRPSRLIWGTRSRPSAQRRIESSPPTSLTVSDPVVPPTLPNPVPKDTELPPLSEKLANTILLKGPCGSGKTAAVYACADELNWKVFEFYAGIGKRSGAGFINEVGGAGENHRVGGPILQEQKNEERHSPTVGFFASPSKRVQKAPSLNNVDPENNDIRQSLIFVEEADILFQSDGNFWPTLIEFIRKSRRPVIISCNDVSQIPLDDLPLQCVIEFAPCDPNLATSYLQAIAFVEGHQIPRSFARRIYMEDGLYRPLDVDIPDQPVHPTPSQDIALLPDLKRAINQLQIQLTGTQNIIEATPDTSLGGLGNWIEEPAAMPELRDEEPLRNFQGKTSSRELETMQRLNSLLDAVSFSDAFIDRRPNAAIEIESIDRYAPSADDVQGNTLLSKVKLPEEAFSIAWTQRDRAMALALAYQARICFEQSGYGQISRQELDPLAVTESPARSFASAWGFNTINLALRRAQYQAKIVTALDEGIGLTGPLLPQAGMVLDYIPWISETARRMCGDRWWMSEEGKGVLLDEALIPGTQ